MDANVLIYLFWPTGQYDYEQHYARVFRNLLRQGNNLFVDFLIISEIVNKVIRIEYKNHLRTNSLTEFQLKYKDYRNSQDGKDTLNDIYIIIENNILIRFKIVGKVFTERDIKNFLVVDELDFVDKATVSLCKENALVLLTNDRDFKNADLDILTGNPNV